MFLDISEIYLIANSKGYPFQSISYQSQLILKESQDFKNLIDKCEYILFVSQEFILERRWQFFNQESIINLNTILAMLSEGFESIINEYIKNQQNNIQNKDIEQILFKYIELLRKLQKKSKQLDIKIYFHKFIQKNFCLIFVYTDNLQLILDGIILYEAFYISQEEMINEMQLEQQKFLYNFINSFIRKKIYMERLQNFINDFQGPKKESIEIYDENQKMIELEFFIQTYKYLIESDKPLYQISLEILQKIKEEKQIKQEQCFYVDRNFTEILTMLRINKSSHDDKFTLSLIVTHMLNIKFLKCMDSLKKQEVAIISLSQSETSHDFNFLLGFGKKITENIFTDINDLGWVFNENYFTDYVKNEQYQLAIENLNSVKQNDTSLCAYLIQYYTEGIKILKAIKFNIQEQSSKVNQIIERFELLRSETFDCLTNTFIIKFNKIMNSQAQQEDFLAFPDLTPYINSIQLIPESHLQEQMFLLLQKLIQIYLFSPEIFQNDMNFEINLYKLMSPFSNQWQKLLSQEFFENIIISINKKNIFNAHFIFNHMIYYTLTNHQDQVINYLQQQQSLIFSIFKSFHELGLITFLTNFNILKKIVTNIINSKVQNEEITNLYIQIITDNIMMWGNRTGLDDHLFNMKHFNEIFTNHFLINLEKIQINLQVEQNEIDQYLVSNKTNSKHSLLSYLLFLNYKQKIFTENSMYFLSQSQIILQKKINLSFFQKVYYFSLMCQNTYTSAIQTTEGTNTYSCIKQAIKSIKEIEESVSLLHEFLTNQHLENSDILNKNLDEGFHNPLLKQFKDQNNLQFLKKLINLQKITDSELMIFQNLRKLNFIQLILINFLKQDNKQTKTIQIQNQNGLLNYLNIIEEKFSLIHLRQYSLYMSKWVIKISTQYIDNLNNLPDTQIEKTRKIETKLNSLLEPNLKSFRNLLIVGIDKQEIEQINQRRIDHFVRIFINVENIVAQLDTTQECKKLSEIYIVIYSLQQILSISFDQKNVPLLQNSNLSQQFYTKFIQFLEQYIALMKSKNISYTNKNENKILFNLQNKKTNAYIYHLNKLSECFYGLLENQVYHLIMRDVLMAENYAEKKILFYKLLEQIFFFWHHYCMQSEQIPQKISKYYEAIISSPFQEDRLQDLGIMVFNIFMQSTYQCSVRIRSCWIYKIIIDFISIKIKNNINVKLAWQYKQPFIMYFICYLEKHFQNALGDWKLETQGGQYLNERVAEAQKLFEENLVLKLQSEQFLNFSASEMEPVTSACTLAMICNLLSRLIQEEKDKEPELDLGIELMFGKWEICLQFLGYVNQVLYHMGNKKLNSEECLTLDYDTFRYSILIIENLLKLQDKSKRRIKRLATADQFTQLFDIMIEIVKNTLRVYQNQILNFQNYKGEMVKISKFKKFMELLVISLYQSTDSYKISRLINEVLPILAEVRLGRVEFEEWQSSMYVIIQQFFLGLILIIDTNFKVENGICVLRNLFYNQFEYIFMNKIKISSMKGNKNINKIMVTDPHIYLFLMDKLCSINDQYIQIDLEKLNSPSLSHQPPDNICLLVNFLINTYVNDLKYVLSYNDQVDKDQSDLYSALGFESSIKILIILCTKFPLIVPYILKQQVDTKNFEKFLIPKEQNISFQQFIFEILPFSQNSSLLFIRFLISENCNYHFFKQEIQGKQLYFSSSLVIREKMIKEIIQVLESNLKNSDFLMNQMSITKWQKFFCALNFSLFQGNNVSQRLHQSENDYLERNEQDKFKVQIYCQRRSFYLKKTLIFLEDVIQICMKNQYQLLILRNCYFLDTFNQVYKGIVKNQFSQKTGLYFDDTNCNHKCHLNYYLNQIITNKFQIRQINQEQIENINTNFNISMIIKYDKLLEQFKPPCLIQPNSTKINNIFWDNEYKNDMLKTNYQFQFEKFMQEFIENKIIQKNLEPNLFMKYLSSNNNFSCQYTNESNYIFDQNNYFVNQQETKTWNIINKIIKHLSSNISASKKKKKNKKSFHQSDSEENKSSDSIVYSSESKSKSETSMHSDSPYQKATIMDMEEEIKIEKRKSSINLNQNIDIVINLDQNQDIEHDQKKIQNEILDNINGFENSDPQNEQLLDIFNWVELGFPKNAIKLYKIDIDDFLELNEDQKYNLFQERKNQFLAEQQFDFEAQGYSQNSLALYNIPQDYFYSLPDNLKKEVLEQRKNEEEAKNNVKISSKKEDKQKEMERQKLEVIILRELQCVQNLFIHKDKLNKQKQHYSPEIISQICSKMQQLDEKSQKSLLHYFSDDFFQLLPEDLKKKAEAMKKELPGSEGEEVSEEASDEEMILDIANSSESNESYSEEDSQDEESKNSEEEDWESVSDKEVQKSQGDKDKDLSEKKGNMIMKDVEEVKEIADNINQEFYENIPYLSDFVIEGLINILFCTASDDSVETEEQKLLCFAKTFQWISLNPLNSYRLIDCLTFLVQITREDIKQILVPFLGFPLSQITYSNQNLVVIQDTEKHLTKIIQKIMYLISFLIGNYFSLPFYLEGGIYKHKQMQVKNTQDYKPIESVELFRSKFSDSDHKSLLKLSIEMIGKEDFSSDQIKSIIELVKSILELGIFEKSIEIEQEGYNIEFFQFLNQKLTKKKDLQYPNYSLDSSLLDNNFINTLSSIIVKNKISLKKDDNFICILDSLINIKVENFVRIFQGVFENYKEELYEKIIMLQKIFKTFQEENQHYIKDQHLNLQENLALKEDLFNELCQDLYQKLESIQMDKEQFHYLRHFIVDMNYFFDSLINKIIRRIFTAKIEDYKKQIDELQEKIELFEEASQDESKKQERLSLKENFKKKKREFAKFLQEEKKIIKIKSQQHLKNILYNVPAINSLFLEIATLLNNISMFVGNNNLENCPHLSNIYMNWQYACKSLIVFHALLNPSEHKSKQNDPSEYKSKQNDFKEMLFQQGSKLEQEQELSLPKLSKLESSVESENTKNNNEDEEKIMHKMDKTYELLYGKLVPVITHFQNSKPDKTNHYEHYIRLAPNKQQLSLQMKLKFLRVLAIQEAKKKSEDLWRDSVYIEIDRLKPWRCTLDCLRKLTPQELFINEDGIDYGGLTREWLALLSKEVFNPDAGLFQTSANGRSIQPNPLSSLVPDHLLHFKYLGRLVGKSLIDDWNMDINFTKSFLKHMLRKTLYVQDLQDIDPELSKNLTWMLENNMDDNDLGYDFSYTIDALGKIITIQLNEDQKQNINEQNKRAYIKGLCIAKMTEDIEQQALAFIRGLVDIVPQEGLDLLSEQELGLHMAGMPAIDIHDLKLNTTYYGYTLDSNIIKWFWEIMDEYDQILRADYLFFLSGSFKVPIGGFKNYPMKIEKTYCSTDNLPVAHTCFNQIDIPDYETKEKFKEKLTIAISEGQQGFYIG